jgi:hypothetical protein
MAKRAKDITSEIPEEVFESLVGIVVVVLLTVVFVAVALLALSGASLAASGVGAAANAGSGNVADATRRLYLISNNWIVRKSAKLAGSPLA